MATTESEPLAGLYEADETEWLDRMAALAAAGRCAELDLPHLAEYLTDMANRDRKEVRSRLVVLLAHLLKWEHQPDRRSGSWLATILEQQRALEFDLESRTLRLHALSVFDDAYARAVRAVAAETGLSPATFPAVCGWDLDALLADRGEQPTPDTSDGE